MNLGRLLVRICGCFAVFSLFLEYPAEAQNKTIRLRNETIVTAPKTNSPKRAQPSVAQSQVSGLFLIQFESGLTPAQRARVQSEGVELLKYVPQDAFIARFSQAAPERLRSLGFVRYVGPYRPEHKIHRRLATAASAAQAGQNVGVVLLLSPGATASQISQAGALFTRIDHQSQLRQGTVLRGQIDPANLSALAQADSVLWMEPMPHRKLVDELASKIVGGDDGNVGTPTITQQLGYGGQGVTVCVADTGLDSGDTNTMHVDVRGRVVGFKPYGSLTDGSDGYGHGTHAAGIVAGNAASGEKDPDTGAFYGLGVASGANLFVERIFDGDAAEVIPAPADSDLTKDAVRNGAVIGSNSWGNDVQGEYDADSAQFDELVRDADPSTPGDQPYILEFSAGNAGPGSETLDSPASGKNVIATGASENVSGTMSQNFGLYDDGADTMADFSSRGPCQDGRIKPDLVAPGSWIASLASSAAPNEAAIAWSAIDDLYVYMGGTSMSGPYAAGAAAVFVQYYKTQHTNAIPSPALVKAALINSANELDQANGGPGPIPNNDEGWGRISLTDLIVTNAGSAPRFYQYVDQSVPLTGGQTYEQNIFVQGSDQPLKITLAYTDVPGFPGAIPALVNDLDLEVIAPDGTTYRGNQFAAGESIRNAPGKDDVNNVEGVHLSQPVPGNYLIRVRARNVVQDARLDTAAIDQDFALVISGDLVRPGIGLILLDRTSYSAPSIIKLEVLDPARAASSSVNVLVKSATEPSGENVVLAAAGHSGAFTGTVSTVVGPAAADGILEVHNGDSIEVDYIDAGSAKRVTFATADLLPPVISGVTEVTDMGVITIKWQTSEPGDSVVRFGTNGLFNLAVTNLDLVTQHSIRLSRLVPGQTYTFYVASTDEAGNASTNNNGGAYFSFVAVATPTVLMVDDYDNPGEESAGAPVIDDGAYTNALAAAGFSYAFWKVIERGSPQLSDLQPFPVVIWRTTDDIVYYGVDADGLPDPSATNNTLTAQQQFMIQSYLNRGGSFFMASMSILTHLGDVPFRKNILQVASFDQNPDPPASCSDCDEDFGVPAFTGQQIGPITQGMSVALDYSSYPTFDDGFGDIYGPDFSDTFGPGTNAIPIAFEAISGKPCGMSYPKIGVDSPGRVVFLSFPLDAVPFSGTAPNNEVTLLRNILKFLVPGANGIGTVAMDKRLYTIPDKATVEVGDSDLTGAGQLQVKFTSTSTASPVTVTLNESSHPGLFRGSVVLVSGNPATNQLVVHNGDTVTATYFDTSNQSNAVAVAIIDTVAPVITQVHSTVDITTANVTWITSKPADSLVQYGESVLPDRTAYKAQFVTNHSVTISGLSPNRTYRYQVVSRDEAGNTTEDDNQGSLYSFQTLAALTPPWLDDLEKGASGWTVVPDSGGSEVNWTLGTPQTGGNTSALSGKNAWGSNLGGQPINFIANSLLVSPTIDLTGFSQATLSFWDIFDFSHGGTSFPPEQGQIMVSTSGSTNSTELEKSPVLADFSNLASPDWERETLDLTPYAGKSIQIVWWYVSVLPSDPAYGWLIDDVEITGTAASNGGTIIISNNLSQASFTLSGPASRSGSGAYIILSNVPPGEYSIDYHDVAFYRTPPPQTNLLSAQGIVTFDGTYTFIDANSNNVSDAWEKYYFGSVTTNRPANLDSDGDGMSDYEEFIAGTNPTNAASKLVFLGASVHKNSTIELQWSAVPGRSYQLLSSPDLKTWTTITDWTSATGSPMSFTVTNTAEAMSSYRLSVRP